MAVFAAMKALLESGCAYDEGLSVAVPVAGDYA